MIQGHEQCVDDDTQCDEELDKWIKHDPCDPLLQLQPAPTTVPDAERVDAFERCFNHFLFHGWSVLVVFFFCREVVDRHCREFIDEGEKEESGEIFYQKMLSEKLHSGWEKISSRTKKFLFFVGLKKID